MSQINWSPPDNLEDVTAKNGAGEAGGETLIYLNAKNIRNMWVRVDFTYGGDLDTLFDIVEADDVSGTNVQPITDNMPIWYNEDTSLGHAWDSFKLASSHTIDTSAGKNQKIMFQIDPMKLEADLTDGALTFKRCLALRIGPTDALNIINVTYLCITRNHAEFDLRV